MPTPFYHLSLAEELLQQSSLPEVIRKFLQTSACTFLFGNTAPDVQVVSGQPRQQTHFFTLPIQAADIPAWELCLLEYPQLADAPELSAPRAAFIAGYLCHLQADWIWVKDLFAPVFGPNCTWCTFQQRLFLHNVLRAYLDVRTFHELKPGLDTCLHQVKPEGWLPFVQDDQLIKWRDFLTPQLQPGATTQTVEVFSSRQGRSAPEFEALLGSDERMQQEVFTHLTLQQVSNCRQRVLGENIQMLSRYLAHLLHDMISPAKRDIYLGVQP